MASFKNDALVERTVEGPLNHYDNQRSVGTAMEKGLAARLGGHNYNILNNQDQHEIYLRELRPTEHYVDDKGRQTAHFFGARRRRFATDERSLVRDCIAAPDAHPRENAMDQRRKEIQLAQMENVQSFRGFQNRSQGSFFLPPAPKRYSISNARYAHEAEKLHARSATKDEWMQRRGEVVTHSASAPSLSLVDPAAGLEAAVRSNTNREATQRQTESAHFAPRQTANTFTTSMDDAPLGQEMSAGMSRLSVNRLENHDFSVTRKNNHFSAQDKLTRADPYFMRPRIGCNNNSVKYDIVSNERKWFRY